MPEQKEIVDVDQFIRSWAEGIDTKALNDAILKLGRLISKFGHDIAANLSLLYQHYQEDYLNPPQRNVRSYKRRARSSKR